MGDAAVDEVTDAVDVEDPLGHDRTAHQRTEVVADIGDDRDQRVAQGVHADRPATSQPLRLRGPDVVGPEVLHQVGPGQPRDIGHRDRPEHQAGQHQLPPGARCGGDREDPQLDAEDQLGEGTDDEDRHRDDHQAADRHQGVGPPAASHPGPDAGRDTHDDLEDDRDDGQPQRGREADGELVQDGVAVEVRPQVAADQPAEVVAVLHQDRLVEVVLLGELRHVRRRAGPLAAPSGDRIARQGEHHQEDQERRSDQDRDHLQQSADDIGSHGCSSRTGGIPWVSAAVEQRTPPYRPPGTGPWRSGTVARVAGRHRPAGTDPGGPVGSDQGITVDPVSLLLDGRVVDLAERVDLDVGDVGRPDHRTGGGPQRQGRQVLRQHLLGRLVLGVGIGRRLGGVALLEQVVELSAGVVEVVRRGAGGVHRGQEVLDRRVVHLPAVAEHALDLAVLHLVEQGLEVRGHDDLAVQTQGVLDRVAGGVGPRLVAAVTVDRQGQGAVVATGLLVERLGLLGVVGAGVAAGAGLVAVDGRSGPGIGRRTGRHEDLLGDLRTVDRHRDRLAQGRVLQLLVDRGEGDQLDHALLRDGVATVGVALPLVVHQHAGRHLIGGVQVVRHRIGVGRVGRLVDPVGDLVGVAGPLTLVGRVLLHHDVRGVLRHELVRPGADRLGLVGLGILEEGVGQRRERGVAHPQRQVRDRRGGLEGEGVVVHHRQAGHLVGLGLGGALLVGALQVVIALHRLEEVARLHAVRSVRRVVPGIDEVRRLHRGAVVERPVVLQLDGEVLVVRRLDRLGDVHLRRRGVDVVVHQLGRQGLQDHVAAALGGVRRDEGLLRGAPADGDRPAGAAAGRTRAATTAGGGEHGHDRHGGECGHTDISTHELPPWFRRPLWRRVRTPRPSVGRSACIVSDGPP
ncbi:hypothetical protein SDC9_73289 [bioreactor metagenome]|uniref:Uncharacterized protein n=1 Tax=bioreactor metagenome TaxID=1076179 RepID=A0A644YKZ5_9ZZZZ